jgi:CHAT domain-containing protein
MFVSPWWFENRLRANCTYWTRGSKRTIFLLAAAFFWIAVHALGCSGSLSTAENGPQSEKKAAFELRSRGLFDSSIVHFKNAASMLRSSGRDGSYIQCLNGIADNLIRKSALSAADSLLADIARSKFSLVGKDSLMLAETLSLRAYIANYSDRFDEALDCARRCISIESRYMQENDPALASGHFLLGIINWRKGSYTDALQSLLRAHEIQAASPVVPATERANTIVTIGAVYDAMGEYSSALRRYDEAIQFLRKNQQEQSASAATCYHYMAVSSRSLGEYEAAVEYEKKALAIDERLYGHQHLAVSAELAQLGDTYTWTGDFEPAREYYQEALAIMSRLLTPDHSSLAELERKLARLALETNQIDSAYALITKAAQTKSRNLGPDHPVMSDVYEDMGDILRRRGEGKEALDYYTRAVAIKRNVTPEPPFLDLAALSQKMAEVHCTEGKLQLAVDALQTATSLQDSSLSHNQFVTSAILRSLGDLQRRLGQTDQALDSYSRSLEALTDNGHDATPSKQEVGILVARAELLEERYRKAGRRIDDLKAAVSSYDSAAAISVRLREGYQARESKLALQEEVMPIISAGLSLSAEVYRLTGEREFENAAFRFAERSKSAVLTETLRDAQAKHASGIPDTLLEHERRLSEAIAAAQTKLLLLNHTGDSVQVSAIHHRLFTARATRNQLWENLAASFPAFRQLRMQEDVASIESVRKALPPRTTLLSYAFAGNALYLFTLSRDRSRLHMLGSSESIEQAARRLRTAIKTVDRADYLQNARFLYARLMKPAEKDIAPGTRLVIVPDGILHYIPFGALLPEGALRKASAATVNFTRLPYLITSHEVIYALCATLYRDAAQRDLQPRSFEPTFAGYAPVFPDSSKPPLFAQNLRRNGNERSVVVDGKMFSELRYSEEEVRTIAAAFDDAGVPEAGFFRDDATKQKFLETAANYSIVHIATHGMIDEQSPGLSGIIFSPSGSRQATKDDILYAGETYALHLNASLLVLGVCESGLGKYARGEGVMALTRAFASAGARNIAYSLWKVFDRHAADLMQRFYARILRGEQYSSALREAKLEMIANKSTAFPLAWAGFVLSGE